MALDEQLDKYKAMSMTNRFAIMAVLGLAWPAYFYMEEDEKIGLSVASAQSELSAETTKLNAAKGKAAQVDRLTVDILKTQKKLEKVKEVLPTNFNIDDILREVATVAQDTDVTIESFKPETGGKPAGGTKVSREIISLQVLGKFKAVTTFYDALLHFKNLVHLSDIQYRINRTETAEPEAGAPQSSADLYEKMKVKTSASFIVYHSQTLR